MGVSAPKGARGAPRESPPQEEPKKGSKKGVSVPKGTRGSSRARGTPEGVSAPNGAREVQKKPGGLQRESLLQKDPEGL